MWVPDAAQEALRDLSRAREDMKIHDKQLRQRLSGFLLRHGRIYEGKQRWTQAFWRWLELERFDSPYQQIVMEEYAAAVRAAQARTATTRAAIVPGSGALEPGRSGPSADGAARHPTYRGHHFIGRVG